MICAQPAVSGSETVLGATTLPGSLAQTPLGTRPPARPTITTSARRYATIRPARSRFDPTTPPTRAGFGTRPRVKWRAGAMRRVAVGDRSQSPHRRVGDPRLPLTLRLGPGRGPSPRVVRRLRRSISSDRLTRSGGRFRCPGALSSAQPRSPGILGKRPKRGSDPVPVVIR